MPAVHGNPLSPSPILHAADNVNAEAAREITDGIDTFEAHAKAETAKYATLE